MDKRESFSEDMICPACGVKHQIHFHLIKQNDNFDFPQGADYQGQCMFTDKLIYLLKEEEHNGDSREWI